MTEFKSRIWRVNVREQTLKHEPSNKEEDHQPENKMVFDLSRQVLEHFLLG